MPSINQGWNESISQVLDSNFVENSWWYFETEVGENRVFLLEDHGFKFDLWVLHCKVEESMDRACGAIGLIFCRKKKRVTGYHRSVRGYAVFLMTFRRYHSIFPSNNQKNSILVRSYA